MESIIAPRAIALGLVLFVGISLPLLFTHYSRASSSRLPGWVVVALTISLFAMPAYRYVADRLRYANSTMSAQPASHSLLYELSPTFTEWIAEPVALFVAGGLLGCIGIIIYEVLGSRNPARPIRGLKNGR